MSNKKEPVLNTRESWKDFCFETGFHAQPMGHGRFQETRIYNKIHKIFGNEKIDLSTNDHRSSIRVTKVRLVEFEAEYGRVEAQSITEQGRIIIWTEQLVVVLEWREMRGEYFTAIPRHPPTL